MSYDLLLVRAAPDATPEEVAALALAAAGRDLPDDAPDPAAEARKRALADALRAADPSLEPYEFDFAEIARFEHTSEAQARRRHRHVELNGPEDGPGIQVTLHDDWASLTLPYWHRGAESDAGWDRTWLYLRVLVERGGFTAYDPQLERPLDPDADRPPARQARDGGGAAEGAAAPSGA